MRLPSIKSQGKIGLRALVEQMGQPGYRARQIAAWLYGQPPGHIVTSFEQMTDLPASLRGLLGRERSLDPPVVLQRQISADGTRKYLVRLAADTTVEAVAIPSARGRITVCFSTQAGCAMGCVFCATGKSGLVRSLGAGEMVDQLLAIARDFTISPPANSSHPPHISNAVAMGQGEPFCNYEATLEALRILNDERLLGIGARHLTVSTCGLLDGIRRFAEEPEQFTLAVSLHSAVQSTRDMLMPGLVSQPLDQLKQELRYYAINTGRRPTLEYALIAGINDGPEDLAALIDFASGAGALSFHVNLLALNPIVLPKRPAGGNTLPASSSVAAKTASLATATTVPAALAMTASSAATITAFAAELSRAKIEVSVRVSRGADIQGACGQLAQDCANPLSANPLY